MRKDINAGSFLILSHSAWRTEKVSVDRVFIRRTRLVKTVQDLAQQKKIALAYHQGKTNHRRVNETFSALKRKYFWSGMQRTIERVHGDCKVCPQKKYDRHPPIGVQKETPFAPLCNLQVDTFTWFNWVTVLDVFSKGAMAHRIQERIAEAVLKALSLWFQFYGIPDRISSVGSREFDNADYARQCGLSALRGTGIHLGIRRAEVALNGSIARWGIISECFTLTMVWRLTRRFLQLRPTITLSTWRRDSLLVHGTPRNIEYRSIFNRFKANRRLA